MSDQFILITCNICKIPKSTSHYHKDRSKQSGYRASCKECVHKGNKRSYIKNSTKENRRKSKLKCRYGLSVEDFTEKEIEQNFCCAICGYKPLTRPLYVDHDHKTNLVRGLICLKCNVILGQCDDSIDILEKAIVYLKRYL